MDLGKAISSLQTQCKQCRDLLSAEDTWLPAIEKKVYELQHGHAMLNRFVQGQDEEKRNTLNLFLEESKTKIREDYTQLTSNRHQFVQVIRQAINDMLAVYRVILDRTTQWRRCFRRSLAGIPAPNQFPNGLDAGLPELQEVYGATIDVAWKFRLHARMMLEKASHKLALITDEHINQLLKTLEQIMQLLDVLVQSIIQQSFIVTQQPLGGVLKNMKDFEVAARLLIGNKCGLELSPPDVSIHVVRAEDIKVLKASATAVKTEGGVETNPGQLLQFIHHSRAQQCVDACEQAGNVPRIGRGTTATSARKQKLKVSDDTGDATVAFKGLCVSLDQRRVPKGGTARAKESGGASVANTKYHFLCMSQFSIGSGPDALTAGAVAMSAPFVVTVHHTQDKASHGTILWDYAFADVLTEHVPEVACWSDLSEVLAAHFTQAAAAQRGLTGEDLAYMAEKLLQTTADKIRPDDLIPWHRFAIDGMLEHGQFPFWDWFYSAAQLVRKELKDYWNHPRRLIYGFLSREMCSSLLKTSQKPCMLIRFSDNRLGAISVGFITPETPDAIHLRPFDSRDLQQMPLVQRIASCPSFFNVQTLFPDVDKTELLALAGQGGADHVVMDGPYAQTRTIMVVPSEGAQMKQHGSPQDPLARFLETLSVPSDYDSPGSATGFSEFDPYLMPASQSSSQPHPSTTAEFTNLTPFNAPQQHQQQQQYSMQHLPQQQPQQALPEITISQQPPLYNEYGIDDFSSLLSYTESVPPGVNNNMMIHGIPFTNGSTSMEH